eukprot:scaffold13178_cov84-Skeletonema_dohrnii-CCMP3373.AAC.1
MIVSSTICAANEAVAGPQVSVCRYLLIFINFEEFVSSFRMHSHLISASLFTVDNAIYLKRRLLDDNIIDKEILSTYSQLATQQCNFTTPLSTLLTAKPGDSCPFSVRIGIARLGVDIMEDITSEEDGSNNSTTVFLEGTRDLIVWNMDNKNEAFRCFYDMTMNTTTTTTATSNNNEEVQTVVERGDDIMIFFPTDVLSNGVENVVSAPGLYQMMDGMVGWSTDVASGISNVTKIDGEFADLCEELGVGGGGSGGALPSSDMSAGKQMDPPPTSSDGGDPSVSIFNAESPSAGFTFMQASWRFMMMLMVLGLCFFVY